MSFAHSNIARATKAMLDPLYHPRHILPLASNLGTFRVRKEKLSRYCSPLISFISRWRGQKLPVPFSRHTHQRYLPLHQYCTSTGTCTSTLRNITTRQRLVSAFCELVSHGWGSNDWIITGNALLYSGWPHGVAIVLSSPLD